MDFTIVTPSLNYGRYIGDCLASVREQEGVAIQHLIIDGGSCDETEAIVSSFPHASFAQEPDGGMSCAINKGFRQAVGDWVMWLNADDRLKPGALAAVKKFVDRHPDGDVIYGGWDFVDEGGGFQKRMTVFPFQRRMLSHLGCYIGSTACFFRRSTTISEGLILDEDYKFVMDGEYLNRLAAEGKEFRYLPEILAEFRWHGNNLSTRNRSADDASAWLKLERQLAESRAIRRAYGWSFFKNEHLNAVVDAGLFYAFLFQKGLLKRWYRRLSG